MTLLKLFLTTKNGDGKEEIDSKIFRNNLCRILRADDYTKISNNVVNLELRKLYKNRVESYHLLFDGPNGILFAEARLLSEIPMIDIVKIWKNYNWEVMDKTTGLLMCHTLIGNVSLKDMAIWRAWTSSETVIEFLVKGGRTDLAQLAMKYREDKKKVKSSILNSKLTKPQVARLIQEEFSEEMVDLSASMNIDPTIAKSITTYMETSDVTLPQVHSMIRKHGAEVTKNCLKAGFTKDHLNYILEKGIKISDIALVNGFPYGAGVK